MDSQDQAGFEQEGGQSSARVGWRVNYTHPQASCSLGSQAEKSAPPCLIAKHTLKCQANK